MDLSLRDRFQFQQPLSNRLGIRSQSQFTLGGFVIGAHDRNTDRRQSKGDLFDGRFFTSLRKEDRDPVHGRSNFGKDLLRIRNSGIELSQREAATFATNAGQFFDPRQRLNGFLDLLADPAFHFIGGGSRVGNRYKNDIQLKFRKRFPTHSKEAAKAGDQDQNDKNIDSRNVIDCPTYHCLHFAFSPSTAI